MTTIKDIAKIAGVNVSSVSRALSGSTEVSEETRVRIAKIADELGYTPNYSARALVGKGTRLIGMVVPEINSNYYAQIVNNVQNELNDRGFTLIIGTTGFDANKEVKNLEMFMGRKVEGIILSGIVGKAAESYLDKRREKSNLPVVFFEPLEKTIRHDCLLIDGYEGMRLAIKHLVELGHKRIGFTGEDISSRYRLPLFKRLLKEFEIQPEERFIKSGGERFELGGYLRMKELLFEKELPTAIMAAYDNIAIGVMKAIQEANLKVPEDISVVGYDNIRESEFLAVPLTTVFPPTFEMVSRGVKLLLAGIEKTEEREREAVTLSPQLIVRNSTSLPKNKTDSIIKHNKID